jgi:mitochondrial fission protein ELM1
MKVLVLDDGNRGNLMQALGIAGYLPADISVVRVKMRGPSYKLPGRAGAYPAAAKIAGLLFCLGQQRCAEATLSFFLADRKFLNGSKCDLIISAGSVLAPLNLALAKRQKAKAICVMTPECVPLRYFDLLIVPEHDLKRHPKLLKLQNVFVTLGAPNGINPGMLKDRARDLEKIAPAPNGKRKVGVLIGGDDQNYSIDRRWIDDLVDALLLNENNVYYLTTSRRTSKPAIAQLIKRTESNPMFVYREFPGQSKYSYYHGILGLSDILCVTEDSVNMVSEACSSGKPVVVLGVKRKKASLVFDETILRLVDSGYCRFLSASRFPELQSFLEDAKNPAGILNEAERCAHKILTILK